MATPGTGPLIVLEQNQYDIERYEYPIDQFDNNIPNFIEFYINLPTVAKYESLIADGGKTDSVSDQNLNRSRGNNVAVANFVSATASAKTLQLGIGGIEIFSNFNRDRQRGILGNFLNGAETVGKAVVGGAVAVAIGEVSQSIQKKPRYNRTKGVIRLYMPETVFHTNSHDYDVQSLTDALGLLGMGERFSGMLPDTETFLNAIVGEQKFSDLFSGFGGVRGTEALGRLFEATGLAGSGYTDFQLRSQNAAINPQLEVVFKRTENRQFTYMFKFQPRSEKEAEQVRLIIKKFKFYAAPEMADGTGLYYIPPAQFDIIYKFRKDKTEEENKYIGKISSCVLENIDVDYSPAGQFATYSDGMPVQINMQLRFREVDTITREMVAAGF